MQRFDVVTKKIIFFVGHLGFHAIEKCLTLTNWHASDLDSARIK